ncbi:shikimate dehydrogenase [Rhodobacteraceae bacterium CCMM004]|nr:shikimate dehydrogenase [Rhodobacteraceae bacterium CCMM004]
MPQPTALPHAPLSGLTRLVAHLGVPTRSFTAPRILNPWFAAEGIDAAVVPLGCGPADFPTFLPQVLRLSNVLGALVTMPHKATAAGLAARLGPMAAVCGACNVVRLSADGAVEGEMFDGAGFVHAAGTGAVAGRTGLVVGAGGVGAAIAAALADAGAARLILSDVDAARARALAARLTAAGWRAEVGPPNAAAAQFAVNATPLGMAAGDPMPFDPAALPPGALVGDVVLGAGRTPLLRAADAAGCATVDGEEMLLAQLPACLAYLGLPVPPPGTLRRPPPPDV